MMVKKKLFCSLFLIILLGGCSVADKGKDNSEDIKDEKDFEEVESVISLDEFIVSLNKESIKSDFSLEEGFKGVYEEYEDGYLYVFESIDGEVVDTLIEQFVGIEYSVDDEVEKKIEEMDNNGYNIDDEVEMNDNDYIEDFGFYMEEDLIDGEVSTFDIGDYYEDNITLTFEDDYLYNFIIGFDFETKEVERLLLYVEERGKDGESIE